MEDGFSITDLHETLELLEKSGDAELIQQLSKGIRKIDNYGLELIIQSKKIPLDLRSSATIEYQSRDDLDWEKFEELALDIFTESGDASRIGSILMKMEKQPPANV